jgi:hypothetical protein
MTLDNAIKELRKVNVTVPKPMRLPTPVEVDNAEKKLQVSFHPDYRRYLLEASDVVYGTLEPATVTPGGGYTDLFDICMSAWDQMSVPKDLLPICEDNGDYFCMTKHGEIVYWSHNGVCGEKWENFATWVKEAWLR